MRQRSGKEYMPSVIGSAESRSLPACLEVKGRSAVGIQCPWGDTPLVRSARRSIHLLNQGLHFGTAAFPLPSDEEEQADQEGGVHRWFWREIVVKRNHEVTPGGPRASDWDIGR
jgi:hypothetical protein